MARITVKDLPQSDTLDRQAMAAIQGGSRRGARPMAPQDTKQPQNRVVDYPPGFGATTVARNAVRS